MTSRLLVALGYELDPEVIDARAIDFFTYGQCWALAEVLHRQEGWPVILEAWDEGDDWKHALVQHPSGGLVDIYGLSARSDEREYQPMEKSGYSFVDLARHCDHGEQGAYYRRRSLQVAEIFAPLVIDKVEADRRAAIDRFLQRAA